jgi:hypothetical protein
MEHTRWSMIYFAAVQKQNDLVATFHALRRLADILVVLARHTAASKPGHLWILGPKHHLGC